MRFLRSWLQARRLRRLERGFVKHAATRTLAVLVYRNGGPIKVTYAEILGASDLHIRRGDDDGILLVGTEVRVPGQHEFVVEGRFS